MKKENDDDGDDADQQLMKWITIKLPSFIVFFVYY
jgi:hypothetical protein